MDNENTQAPQEVKVDNTGGPQIPNAGKAPNMQGVPTEQVAEQPVSQSQAPEPKPQALDLEALKKSLAPDKPATDAPEQQQDPASLETGNAILDAGISMLQKVAGLNSEDVQRALGKAIQFNNPELIDSAFLQERFKEHAEYAELLCQAYYKDRQDQATNVVKSVYEAAGGEEQWNTAKDIFKARAPAHHQAAARALIDSGQVKEGVSLILDYCRSEGLVVQQGQQVRGAAGLAGAALSQSEFSSEYSKLRAEAGNRSLESGPFAQRYQNLLARRQAGRAIGR